jgi:hypothetical protein
MKKFHHNLASADFGGSAPAFRILAKISENISSVSRAPFQPNLRALIIDSTILWTWVALVG